MSEPFWVPLGGAGVDYKGDWAVGTQYAPGDVVRSGGIDYLAVNPSLGSTPPAAVGSTVPLVTALPASPVDGQEIILCDSLTAPTYAWRFRYIAAKASNKWQFVGGAPLSVLVAAAQTTSSATWVDLATDGPTFTIPVAGRYLAQFACHGSVASAATIYYGLFLGGVQAVIANETPAGAGYHCALAGQWALDTTAGQVLKMRYQSGTGGTVCTFDTRSMVVTPVAVGG